MSCQCGGVTTLNQFGGCCQCGELPALREEGPPGPPGPDGGVPVFTVGTVTTGVPSVTVNQITPLLYTIDFVLPTVPTNTANLWSDTQTFEVQAVFQAGIAVTGATILTGTLGVSGLSTLQDVSVLGDLGVNGLCSLASLAVANDVSVGGNLGVTGNTTFGGTVTFASPPDLSIVALTANENARGFLVLDHNNVIKYVAGQGYTGRGQAPATGLVNIPPSTGGLQICNPLVITVPVLTPNQPTPLVDIEAVIMYEGGGSSSDLTFSLWLGTIGVGSALEFWDIANPGGESKQIALRAVGAQLALGANNFRISGDNNDVSATITITKVVWRARS